MRRAGYLLAALTGLALLIGVGAGPAAAHSVLLQTSPASGATVATAPDSIVLIFNEMPQGEFSTIHITGPDGKRRDDGHVQVVNDRVSEAFAGTRPAGRYVVDWRVVSADGHPVSGEFTFTARSAAASVAATAVTTPAPKKSSSNVGVIIGIVAAVVIFGGLIVFLLRRKRSGRDSALHE
ncbi:MAG TPA: copper resistance CopC family protein [Frankiaceae bacterium]|nr:copper resistance CopC family protein [Frankiaceae bacterium]